MVQALRLAQCAHRFCDAAEPLVRNAEIEVGDRILRVRRNGALVASDRCVEVTGLEQ